MYLKLKICGRKVEKFPAKTDALRVGLLQHQSWKHLRGHREHFCEHGTLGGFGRQVKPFSLRISMFREYLVTQDHTGP